MLNFSYCFMLTIMIDKGRKVLKVEYFFHDYIYPRLCTKLFFDVFLNRTFIYGKAAFYISSHA